MTAKIKYKFGRALQRWSEFSTDERIITICAISLFLPYYLVAVPGLFAVFRALLVPEIRHRMTAVSASGYIYASFPIFTFPAVIFYNWFGLLGGAVLWLMLVFMLYLFTVMRVRFYNNIIDLILLLSMVALAVAVSAKILYSCSGIAVYHFMFDSNNGSTMI